jgi:hypothetical protein
MHDVGIDHALAYFRQQPIMPGIVERKHHRLPIPKTFRLRSSSYAGGILLKDAALPSSAA